MYSVRGVGSGVFREINSRNRFLVLITALSRPTRHEVTPTEMFECEKV